MNSKRTQYVEIIILNLNSSDAASESHTAVKHKLPVGKKTESYEMWKKRILEKAYKDLEMRNIANLVQ